ncbi:chemotaxis protein CheD [Candidatus Woesearchaeota archaeon]|nr:MAG: chemotaxis protein CheD [Candidatus Woesearchaeota archaeon]
MGAQEIIVGIGGLVVHHNPIILTCLGLGSCVGVALYDKENHIGGLAHVMLPESKEYTGIRDDKNSIEKLNRYADVAIPTMIKDMVNIGAKKNNIRSKIVGGAQMFIQINDEFAIGKRNVITVKKILEENNIPIDAEETGGSKGRSMKFDTSNQEITVKSIHDEKII